MNSGFIEKLIGRLDKLGPRQVQVLVDRLIREKGFLESVFEALQEGVLILDRDGVVTFLNQSAGLLFGVNRDDAAGKKLDLLVRGLDWDSLIRPGRQAVSRDLEIFYPENRFLNFYLAPIAEDLEGMEEQLGFVMLVRDITESRRRAEATLESEKLNALTLLAAGVAHEIGNPLNSLGIHLQLLTRKLKQLPKGDQAILGEHLATARREIDRLDHLLKDFLQAIRPTSPQRKTTQIHDLIQETLHTLEPELSAREVKVVLELDENLPPLSLDPHQITQALFNVIKNAYQSLEQGGTLTLSTTHNDYEIRIAIADNGSGMPPEMIGTMFEPFQSDREGGTGLGLLIVRRIIREHGGEIEVESEPGEGTRVSLFFPRSEKRLRYIETDEPSEVIEV